MGYRLVDRPKPARGQTGLVVVACRLRPKLGKCGVMGEQGDVPCLGLPLAGRRCFVLFQHLENRAVQTTALADQEGLIGLVADQGMLEQIALGGPAGMTADQPGTQQGLEAVMHRLGRAVGHRGQRSVVKFPADDGGDLRDRLGGGHSVQPGHQHVVQGRGNGECCLPRWTLARTPLVLAAMFEHRFRQLFEKQRHAVGPGDDVVAGPGRQRCRRQMVDQPSCLVLVQPAEIERGDLAGAVPGGHEFRTGGHHQEDRTGRGQVDQPVEHILRTRIDPVNVLDQNEPRMLVERAEKEPRQPLQRGAALVSGIAAAGIALLRDPGEPRQGRKRERRVAVDIAQQRPQPVALPCEVRARLAAERSRQQGPQRKEGDLAVVGRTVDRDAAGRRNRLGVPKCLQQSRFADAGLATDERDLALAGGRPPPAASIPAAGRVRARVRP
jgi:hypothetical protein